MKLLAPFGTRPLPKFPGILALLGPGVIWMAAAQGSGELIWWPYLIAKYGLGFLILLVPACLLQYPLTFEIGRYTALTGESIWRGFLRLHPLFGLLMWITMLVTFIWFGAYVSASGTALAELTSFPASWSTKGQSLFWALVLICGYTLVLANSKNTYLFLEKLMWVVAIVTVVGLVVSVSHPEVSKQIPVFVEGIFFWHPLAVPWDSADLEKLATALTYAGMGGLWCTFYSFWVFGEGVMRGSEQPASGASLPSAAPEELASEAPKWRRYLLFDSAIGIFGNIFTTLLTCLLAYALLHPKGIVPDGWRLAVEQAGFFELTWGNTGRILFLFIAASFLADTWPTVADFFVKVNVDMFQHFFPASRKIAALKLYRVQIWLLGVASAVTIFIDQPGSLLLFSGVLSFLTAPVLSLAVLWLMHFRLKPLLPPELRPGRISFALLAAGFLIYLGLSFVYLGVKFGVTPF